MKRKQQSKARDGQTPDFDTLNARIYDEIARNPRRALQLAERGVSLARNIRSPSSAAKMLHSRAHAFRECGMYREAIRDYERAAKIYRKEGHNFEAWRTTIGKLDGLDQLGKYREALRVARAARRYFRNAGLKIWEAKISANVGNVYQHLDRYPQALEHYKFAHQILSRERPLDGHVALFNQATVYLCSGEPAASLPLLKECRNFFEQENLSSFLGRTHYNLAFANHLLGKYQDALHHLAEARTFFQKFRDTRFLAACYLDEAELFLRLNRLQESIRSGRKGSSLFRGLKKPYEQAESSAVVGEALLASDSIHEAIHFLKTSRTFFQKHKNWIKSAELDSLLAQAYGKMSQLSKSRFYLNRSLRTLSAQKLYPKMLSVLTHIAEVEITAGNWKRAESELRKAIPWLRRINLPSVLYRFYLLWGKVELTIGRKTARQTMEKAIDLVESMRSEIPSEDLRISFFEDKLAAYHALLAQALQRADPEAVEDAFCYTERARSRVLMDLLEGSITFQKDQEMSRLLAEIAALQDENWRRSIREDQQVRAGREERRREMRITSLLRQLQRSQARPAWEEISVPQVQQILNGDQALVSYYILNGQLHAFVIDRNRMTSHAGIANASTLFQRWQFLRLQLERVPAGAEILDQSYLHSIRDLSSGLVLPIYERLRHFRTWTIIPHGWLHAFPFHGLTGPAGPLIDHHVFNYAPSASIFLHSQRSKQKKGGEILILGHADDYAPQIDREVKAIYQIFPQARLFTNRSADSTKLREFGTDSSIIHIASHGRFLKDKPLFSGLLLSDGWLTLPQIYGMRLPADLITLSGCETGTNEISGGDELLGLTRGFLYAGASSMLVSLWRVFDESSAFFMKIFYQAIADGITKRDAWQKAVLETRTHWPNPYYWAPFLLIGKI